MVDCGSSTSDDSITYSNIITHTDLSAEDDSVADFGRAGDAGLGSDKTVLSQAYVMSDADKIINLCATSDNGEAELCPVNARPSTDFDVVSDAYGTQMGDVTILTIATSIAETL